MTDKKTRTSRKNQSPTILWYDTDRIENYTMNIAKAYFRKAVTNSGTYLLSRYLATTEEYTYRHRLMGEIYEVRR
jgi:hypothetical protein